MITPSAFKRHCLLVAFILGLHSQDIIAQAHVAETQWSTTPRIGVAAMALPRRRADSGRIRPDNSPRVPSDASPGGRADQKTRRNFRNGADPDPEDENERMLSTTPPHRQRRQRQWRTSSNTDGKQNTWGKGRCYSGALFRHDLILPPLDVSASVQETVSLNDCSRGGVQSTAATVQNRTHDDCPSLSLPATYARTKCDQLPLAVPSPREEDQSPLEVIYTNNPKNVEKWLADNISEGKSGEGAALGFDVEMVPTAYWKQKEKHHEHLLFEGPATVQLSTPDSCIVAHLTRDWGKRRSTCCRAIEALLKDKTIIKVGAGIDNDMLELYRWNRRLEARTRFDISGVGCDASRGTPRVGLKKLARAVIGVEMKKSRNLALSNWSRVPLSYSRLAYCARDAWAGAAVMRELARRKPDTFGYDAVLELLEGERSMKELDLRARKRKHAKRTITEITRQFGKYAHVGCNDGSSIRDGMPPRLKKELSRLRSVIIETAPDDVITFDAEDLGLIILPDY